MILRNCKEKGNFSRNLVVVVGVSGLPAQPVDKRMISARAVVDGWQLGEEGLGRAASARERSLVVVGVPGSGKTTLLRTLAECAGSP